MRTQTPSGGPVRGADRLPGGGAAAWRRTAGVVHGASRDEYGAFPANVAPEAVASYTYRKARTTLAL